MDVSTRQAAEADLAGKAAQYRPDELARYAQRVMDWLHPDGDLTDTERARKRGITLSNQQYDGMSRLSGYLTPQARATFEAVLAKLAAPGATNPDDHTPVIDTTPDAAAIDRDTRSQAQRNHDGLLAGLRALIASGKLGQHNGLPVSIVVTTTLTDLQTGAGKGFTGGGTLLPMADVIRMTSHAHHYSPASGRYPQAIFDHGTPLALYHTKRLASPAQRIMLFANDRGCTKPGCDAPAYHSQAHHVTAWTSTGRTDITELTLACGPDNRLAEKGWTTHNNTHGHTEWLPPPHLDHGQPWTCEIHYTCACCCLPPNLRRPLRRTARRGPPTRGLPKAVRAAKMGARRVPRQRRQRINRQAPPRLRADVGRHHRRQDRRRGGLGPGPAPSPSHRAGSLHVISRREAAGPGHRRRRR
ncbi:REP13E12 repeat-containing protein [Mycobacterium tuberculosis]|uniref:REP13E12 repeat-containing protein n=2 Tax=Mycobacterium tuberculosis TaxID=1773 RepID=A0A655EES5_MYCTX|nr:REP13E12 repeat-containing protein [Mycobacterium tuberculosis]CNV18047.1 REP13E12 repeat-containing protein [Mycobacterium tuberculosis]VCU48314.1 unnamed protein product [Mycobacterium tuberculosis]